MKIYTAKTIKEVIEIACNDLGVQEEELNYKIVEEKKSLFSRRTTIEVYTFDDVVTFIEGHLKNIIEAYGLEYSAKSTVTDGIIKTTIDTSHNSILIGKNGRTLQAFNEIVRVAAFNQFNKRYRILLDINAYKDEKYDKLVFLAKRVAKEVQKSKVNVVLDPMTSDERRVIHNALSTFKNIKTESSGSGHKRQITIIYTEK